MIEYHLIQFRLFPSFSVLGDSIIKERVTQLIHKHKCVYGDFTLTEFDDHVLADNVVSVSLSDSEHLILDRKVILLISLIL